MLERNAGTCFLQAQARGGWHFLQAGSLGGTWQGGAWPDFSTVVSEDPLSLYVMSNSYRVP